MSEEKKLEKINQILLNLSFILKETLLENIMQYLKMISVMVDDIISNTENNEYLSRLFYILSCKSEPLVHFIIEEVLKKRKADIDFHIYYIIIKENHPSVLEDSIETRNFFTYDERFLIEIYNSIIYSQKHKCERKNDSMIISTLTTNPPSESKYTIQVDDFMQVFKLLISDEKLFINLFSIFSNQKDFDDILIKIFQFLIDNSLLRTIEILEDEHGVMFSIRNEICHVSFNKEKEYKVDLSKTNINVIWFVNMKSETKFSDEIFNQYMKNPYADSGYMMLQNFN